MCIISGRAVSSFVIFIMMIRIAILIASLPTSFYARVEVTTIDPVTLVTRYQMECIEETRVNADVIIHIKHRDWKIPNNQKQLVKDWALCVLMKSGIMTKQGVYKVDVALQRVPLSLRENTEKQIDSCLSKTAIPAADIAYRYIKCFRRMKSNHSAIVSAF